MQQPDFSDCKEYSLDEMKNYQNEEDIKRLTQIQQEMHQLKNFQDEIDVLITKNEDPLDIIADQTQKSSANVNNIKQQADGALDDTLNLRSTKITLAFSGVIGAFSMIKGFGLTIGAVVGGYIGRKAGQMSQGNIKEKASD
ncbi:unnamed protein product (macronuclear) [Paramecium tetraurelia]|uniref:t-SNARE coiled-coil homology domain-containing protein n=1 Tax=Paramecium tetraurelia TaxID=5888 RepID=A0E1M6_PARTE|nr:uncharacterized protein GSPATT00022363001 [Paramecium tetraurelia]CAK89193.1 unnamed protein product [Paramecium tetraurelia]|eukprot:XP_001456590.1 hypothetical protein (macronuclear) [Paramecium tetraurelia strain d4-2]